ncbi:MAG: hypothetical protein IT340_21700 [Chloroflexi bacterium]|nr:hypothetical protein [Chloroflexota bacterium]
MESQGAITITRIAGALLASSFVIFVPGGLMFAARNGMAGQPAPTVAYFVLERGFVMAAVVVTALGLAALAALVGAAQADALVPAWLAAATYAVASVLVLVSEAALVRGGRFPDGLIIAYVILAFFAQAAFGAILLWTGFLPAWIGWVAIAWNIAWPVLLPILTPRDIYFPVLHHVIPLVIGIALLWRE